MTKFPLFQILGDSSQVLQYVLSPGDQMSIGGTILYGSSDIYSKQKQLKNYMYKWLGKNMSLRKIKNEQSNIQYIGLKRSQGKILALDLEIYGTMYVHKEKILAINYQYTQNINHESMKQFMFLSRKNFQLQNYVFVQSDNNTYIEKQLGVDQKFSCQKQSVLAFSNTVGTRIQGTAITFSGPGYVFISSAEIMKNQTIIGKVVMTIVFILMIQAFLQGMNYAD